jgi:hypothetical protein
MMNGFTNVKFNTEVFVILYVVSQVAKPVCRVADCSNSRLNVSRRRHNGQGNARFEFLAKVN